MATATTFSGTVRFIFDMQQTSAVAGEDAVYAPNFRYVSQLENGSGADQATKYVADYINIPASTAQTDDLQSGETDWFGTALTATGVVGVLAVNDDPGMTNSTLTIGNAASAQWSDWLGGTDTTIGPIGPNGFMLIYSPGTTKVGAPSDAVDDLLKFAAGSGDGVNMLRAYIAV